MSRGFLIFGSRRCFTRIKRQQWRSETSYRFFSSTTWLRIPHTEHVEVPCASSGHVMVSLHDINHHPATTPVILNLPPFPTQDITNIASYLPSFLHRYPTATIHYRWPLSGQSPPHNNPSSSANDSTHNPLHWPTPIHDTLAGYDHLVNHLAPQPTIANGHSRLQRRPLYLYGSYLGATLAASLALTESHTHEPVAVRGLVAVNGVYNWTTFLPDHPLHRLREKLNEGEGPDGELDPGLQYMRDLMPHLFQRPGDIFDPFASPVLFFHTPGLLVPPSFEERWRPPDYSQLLPRRPDAGPADDVDPYDYVYSDPEDPPPPTLYPESETETESDQESSQESDSAIVIAPQPRKGYLAFPPRNSTLGIPEALLLHNTGQYPVMPEGNRRATAQWKRARNAENSYASQAEALAGLMRRSVEKLELRERKRWEFDDGISDWQGEIMRRVGLGDVGVVGVGEIGKRGEELAALWFEERLD